MVTGIALFAVGAGSAVAAGPLPAQEAEDYESFFADEDLRGAGWAACPDPVTWSVDTRGFTASVARREVRRLKAAWSQWSVASGVNVKFAGTERLNLDPATNGLRPADGSAVPERHVFIAFKTIADFMFKVLDESVPFAAIPEAQHHLFLDQPLAFVSALRTLLAEWRHSKPDRHVG